MSDIRVGDRVRCEGYIVELFARGATVQFDGDSEPLNVLSQAALAACERLPRKLAVGDRVDLIGDTIPGSEGEIRYIDSDEWAAVKWTRQGTRGTYQLSDLRLADPRTGERT